MTNNSNKPSPRKVKRRLAQIKANYNISHHPLTLKDFHRICKAEGIRVLKLDLFTSGFFYSVKGVGPFIALDQKMEPKKFLNVAYHELGHYLMHKPDTAETMYSGEGKKSPKEIEADLFAELATGGGR